MAETDLNSSYTSDRLLGISEVKSALYSWGLGLSVELGLFDVYGSINPHGKLLPQLMILGTGFAIGLGLQKPLANYLHKKARNRKANEGLETKVEALG